MENTKAYKIEITTEKSQGKIKTKSIYFLIGVCTQRPFNSNISKGKHF